jgi:hypothetical protein
MKQIALGLVVTALISTSAWAEEPTGARLKLDGALAGVSFATAAPTQDAAADEGTPVAVSVGADFPSSYYFRGYRQEGDAKLTFQPWVDFGVEGESASFNVGLWNSLHTGDLSDANGCDCGWYETDFYASVAVQNVSLTYTAYTYPKIDDSAIHELMVSTSFDNVLAPSVALAFEFAKPTGLDKGVYLQLGVEPAVPMADDSPVSVSIPVTLGLSLKDYYGDDTFGFFSAGVSVGYALSEAFEIHGSVSAFAFGDYLESYNDKSGLAIASVGFSVGF